jgi:acyl carrier protein
MMLSEEEMVINIIVDQLGIAKEDCIPEKDFIDDLGADSLDIVEMIMAVEEGFGMEITDDELWEIHTIQDVFDCIAKKLADRRSR